jgi:hypothetical protein
VCWPARQSNMQRQALHSSAHQCRILSMCAAFVHSRVALLQPLLQAVPVEGVAAGQRGCTRIHAWAAAATSTRLWQTGAWWRCRWWPCGWLLQACSRGRCRVGCNCRVSQPCDCRGCCCAAGAARAAAAGRGGHVPPADGTLSVHALQLTAGGCMPLPRLHAGGCAAHTLHRPHKGAAHTRGEAGRAGGGYSHGEAARGGSSSKCCQLITDCSTHMALPTSTRVPLTHSPRPKHQGHKAAEEGPSAVGPADGGEGVEHQQLLVTREGTVERGGGREGRKSAAAQDGVG